MLQFHKKKTFVSLLIGAIAVIGMASTSPFAVQPRPFKNLKVLPKNTSHDSLDRLMDEYKVALGVKCNHCHAKGSDNRMDMASDANPIKDVARKMIQMTNEMNDKYLRSIQHVPTDSTAVQLVTCNTCHRGQARPAKPAVLLFPNKW